MTVKRVTNYDYASWGLESLNYGNEYHHSNSPDLDEVIKIINDGIKN